jgi:two-component system, OmpR family, phosphate regulon sensor histidine kinase PhoR
MVQASSDMAGNSAGAAAPSGRPGRAAWRPRILFGLAGTLGLLVLLIALKIVPGPVGFMLGAVLLGAGAAGFVVAGSDDLLSAKPLAAPAAPPVLSEAARFGTLPRAVLDELPDAILLIDEEDRVVIANRAARAGFVGATYERKLLSTLMRRPAVIEAILRVRQSGFGETAEFTDLVPVERVFQVSVTPLVAEVGGPAAILVVIKDLTQIKAVEQMRADFVANASHELRTPLSSLSGFIETLRGHAKDDEAARERFLGIMQDQAGRMRRLIDDLLSLSRIELNEHIPPATALDLASVARDVIDAFQPLAREARITLTLKAEPGLCPAIGERDELVQVLQNLVDNAVKYGRAGSEVEIALGPGAPSGLPDLLGPSCHLAVSDQGDGIAREHIPRLTERFYRVDVKQSRERGGTGLGLAIVKHIVSRHRGRLHIKSDIGKGSVFTVILPAMPDEAAPPGSGAVTK